MSSRQLRNVVSTSLDDVNSSLDVSLVRSEHSNICVSTCIPCPMTRQS